jgi:hypothetical protein
MNVKINEEEFEGRAGRSYVRLGWLWRRFPFLHGNNPEVLSVPFSFDPLKPAEAWWFVCHRVINNPRFPVFQKFPSQKRYSCPICQSNPQTILLPIVLSYRSWMIFREVGEAANVEGIA